MAITKPTIILLIMVIVFSLYWHEGLERQAIAVFSFVLVPHLLSLSLLHISVSRLFSQIVKDSLYNGGVLPMTII